MIWPTRRMTLWHPDSPGMRMTVTVLWPRYHFHPKSATLSEALREYRRVEEARYFTLHFTR